MKKTRYIIFSGIDGSGKSAIIEGLQQRLEAEGLSVYYAWMRFNHIIIKPVHALCRLVGLCRRYQTSQGIVWRHEFYRCRLFCSLYIFLTWLDTCLGSFKLNRQIKNRQTDVVICDRWVYDILVDLAVDTRRRSLLKGKWFSLFLLLLPANKKQYIIERDTKAVIASRFENQEGPNFSFRQKLYKKLQGSNHITVIKNNSSIDAAVDKILLDFNQK